MLWPGPRPVRQLRPQRRRCARRHSCSNPLRGAGPEITAQLLLLADNGSLTPLTPTSTFRPSGPGAEAIADRYWIDQTVTVPGIPAGAQATFIVRGWRTFHGSFENAVAAGEIVAQSAPFTITLGSDIPAPLSTLLPFDVMFLPEPSTITLGIIGAAGLLFWRRK